MKKLLLIIVIIGLLNPFSWAGEKKADEGVKPALLVIDIQNAFLPMMQPEGQKQGLWAMNELMKDFRRKGFPVIRIYHTSPGYGPKPGTKEFEFSEAVEIADSDIVIQKNHGNAFKKTDLQKKLKELGVNTLFLSGLSGTGCVLATYFGAYDLDYQVFLIKGTILSPKAAHTDLVEDICESVGYGALGLILRGAKK
jgi:nicotinamidase-related amidase